jgi:hypothetical protein
MDKYKNMEKTNETRVVFGGRGVYKEGICLVRY